LQADQERTSATYYRIEVAGRLSREWAEWFGNMAITMKHSSQGSTITVLSGPVPDRAALFGILNRIRDLGLRLISVNQIEPDV
jgi:hypothetical protein